MIRVARNLHKQQFSVRRKVNGVWKVIAYTPTLTMRDVRFIISEKGRQRVLERKQKNLHAFAEGTPGKVEAIQEHQREITYNPYRAGHFYWKDTGERVDRVTSAVLRDGKIFGLGSPISAQSGGGNAKV
jgi:hypothetical protein